MRSPKFSIARSRRLNVASTLVALALFACSQPDQGAGSAAPQANDPWQVSLAVSGGIAGIVQEFSVASETAMLTADDERRQVSRSRELTGGEIREIEALLEGIDMTAAGGQTDLLCRDCLLYSLSVQWGTLHYLADYDSMTLPDSTDEALIERLAGLGLSVLQ